MNEGGINAKNMCDQFIKAMDYTINNFIPESNFSVHSTKDFVGNYQPHNKIGRYSINIGFQIKMVLVVIAGLNALLYHWKVSPLMEGLTEDSSSPLIARCTAYTSLAMSTGE